MKTIHILILAMTALCNQSLHPQQANKAPADPGNLIDQYLTRTVPFGFSGTVLVAKDGEILLNKGYGYANRNEKVGNRAASVFSTGSLTKQFTSAAIMKLEMMGKLSTDETLSEFFQNLPEDKRDIALRHLLTHTSGLPIALSEDDFSSITREDYIKKTLNANLEFRPGSDFNYSNVGYTLLAMIIEDRSGLTYEGFLQKYLFQPAGMEQTGYSIPEWKSENFVHIYNGIKDNGTSEVLTKPTWHLIGNGGILSTTDDMFKWVRALKGNSILSETAKKKMFTPFLNDYAFGWDVLDAGNLRQHNGGSTRGNGAELRWFVDEDILTIVFTNSTVNGKKGFQIVRGDLEMLTMGEEIPMPPRLTVVPENLQPYEGTYEFPSGEKFTVEIRHGQASLIIDSQEVLDFIIDSQNYSPGGTNIDLNRKFEKAFSLAFREGDYSGFDFTGASPTLEKEIKNELQMEGITDPHFRVVKTLPSTRSENFKITQVALNADNRFEGESLMLSIVTNNHKYAGLGVDFGFVHPISFDMLPIGNNTFQLYDLNTKINAKVILENKRQIYTLSIGNKTVGGIRKVK